MFDTNGTFGNRYKCVDNGSGGFRGDGLDSLPIFVREKGEGVSKEWSDMRGRGELVLVENGSNNSESDFTLGDAFLVRSCKSGFGGVKVSGRRVQA